MNRRGKRRPDRPTWSAAREDKAHQVETRTIRGRADSGSASALVMRIVKSSALAARLKALEDSHSSRRCDSVAVFVPTAPLGLNGHFVWNPT